MCSSSRSRLKRWCGTFPTAFTVEKNGHIGDSSLLVQKKHRAVDPDTVSPCQGADRFNDSLMVASYPFVIGPVEPGGPHLRKADEIAAPSRRLGDQGLPFFKILFPARIGRRPSGQWRRSVSCPPFQSKSRWQSEGRRPARLRRGECHKFTSYPSSLFPCP